MTDSRGRPRVPPHNLEAEASILGGILIRNEVLALVPQLEPDDFYHPKHRVVFAAMRELEAKGSPIDITMLHAEIDKRGKLEAIGGMAFLAELTLRVPTADNVEHYAKIVTDLRITRDVIVMLATMIEDGYSGATEGGEAYIHDVNSALMTIRTAQEAPARTMGELIREEAAKALKDFEARSRGERVYSGVPTGFTVIDERIGGNQIGITTLLIARPGTGKTTFALAMAENAKQLADMDSMICSYEDRGEAFGQRALAKESGVGTERIRARKLQGSDDFRALSDAMAHSSHRKELLLDCNGMEVEQLVRRIRREQIRRKSLGLKPLRQVIIDYIQKMPIPKWARSRDEGVGHISRVLSTFAATDQLAVVVMCQLNREVEKRDDHRPRLSDIRDSGSLEQDGKVIYGVYYPHQYDSENHHPSEVYLIVLKNAQGEAMGEIPLYWERATHAIYNSHLDYQHHRAVRGR